MAVRATRVTDPVILADIEAEFIAAVYGAARRALDQAAGRLPPPVPSLPAQALQHRSRRRVGLSGTLAAVLSELLGE